MMEGRKRVSFPTPGDRPSMKIELDDQAGQVRVSDDRLFHPGRRAYARRLLDVLRDQPGVRKAEVNLKASACRVDFDPSSTAAEVMARVFADAVRVASATLPKTPWWKHVPVWSTLTASRSNGEFSIRETREDRPVAEVAVGWRRWRNLAMAGGAFGLTIVGVVVPGIPTLPFLLATSYYLARSSPRMDGWLRRAPFLGPILREWEGHSALSWTSKGKLIGLTVTIIVVTVLITPINAVALVAIILMSSLSLYGITRVPTLPSEERAEAPMIGRTLLALPSH